MKSNNVKIPWSKLHVLLQNWAAPIGCGLLFVFLLRSIIFVGYVPSASMEPAIKKESLIFGVRVINTLNRGDIIIFEHINLTLVKRVSALPGDNVQIGGEVVTVPEGHCYVLGDNCKDSIDSRYWTDPFVPLERIIAKLWPFVDNPAAISK